MKDKLAQLSRILVLACGMALSAMSLLVMVSADELPIRVTAALVFASGIIIILLWLLLVRLEPLRVVLRHLQYLTQSSEYMAHLLREITEVMKAIEAVEAEGQTGREKEKGKSGSRPGIRPLTPEEREIEAAVRQFEV